MTVIDPHYGWRLWRQGCLVACIAVLVGCASSPPVEERPVALEQLETTNRAARASFDLGHYKQAAGLYEEALQLALARDDLNAIVDARYNLAVALLYDQDYQRALEVVSQTKDESRRAGKQPSPDLLLLEATVRYRAGQRGDAWATSNDILAIPGVAPEVLASTYFLRGLIAAERGDQEALVISAERLAGTRLHDRVGDQRELHGHLARLRGDAVEAAHAFDQAAALRSQLGDLRGMARALALAGEASQEAGQQREAAGYFLRAGRSAAQQESSEARVWLEQSLSIAQSRGYEDIAREARLHLDSLTAQ